MTRSRHHHEQLAHVVLRRDGGYWRDRIRNYTVLIDGAVVGKIGEFQERSFPVQPGYHDVQLRIDFVGRSQVIHIDLGANETITLECGPGSFLGYLFPACSYINLVDPTRESTAPRQSLGDGPWE